MFFESSSLDQSDEWMTINNLKLNKSNTEFIVTGSQRRPKTVLALGLEDGYSSNAAVIFEERPLSLKSKQQLFSKRHFFTLNRLPVFKDLYLMKVSKHVLCMRLSRVQLIIISNYHMDHQRS